MRLFEGKFTFFRGENAVPRGKIAVPRGKSAFFRGEKRGFGLLPERKCPEERPMNGEFLKILEGKLRTEILRELSAESRAPEGKSENSPHFTLENDGMVGFSWLLGATEVSSGPREESRARRAYGVRKRTPPPRPAHALTPDQKVAYDRLQALTGLSDNFSSTELKRAWRSAALRTHPDQGGRAEEFRLVQQAYQILAGICPRD